MALDWQLYTFMPHVVTIAPYSSINQYGEDQMSANTRTAKAYVAPSKVLDRSATINEQHPSTTAWIADTNIGIHDQITLPDGRVPKILSIETHVEVKGIEHTVVNFA